MNAVDEAVGNEARARTSRFGTLGSTIGLLVVAWGAVLASFPLNDNSFFTHLATGRLILDRGSVPSTDPYTFTAAGEPWTVQSWLASVAYAGAEQAGGTVGLRVLAILIFAGAAALLWRLTRPLESLFPRVGLIAVSLFVATPLWQMRPFMIGVVGLGLVWLALRSELNEWALVPFFWIWVNTHGSFPLAFVLVGAVAIGRLVDRDPVRPCLSLGAKMALGTALGVVGPLGFRALTFPVSAITRSDVFGEIAEWQPPVYRSVGERAFLLLVVVALVAIAHRRRWQLTVPAIVFVVAGVLAQRNIVMAAVVLTAVVAESSGSVGTLRSSDRPRLGAAFTVLGAIAVVLGALGAVVSPADPLLGYPGEALAYLRDVDFTEHRLATEDAQGNLLTVLEGDAGVVFVDDRVDMLPTEVFDDELTLVRGRRGWDTVLDEYEISLVLWATNRPLAPLLAADDDWRVVYSDSSFMVACRRGVVGCNPRSPSR